MACATQVFAGITPERFNCLVQKAAAAGIAISGNAGQATKSGITIRWKFDPAAQTLEVQCMNVLAPSFFCTKVNRNLHQLVESCPPVPKPPVPKPPVPKPPVPVPKPPVPKPPAPAPKPPVPVPEPPVPTPPAPQPPSPPVPVPTPAPPTTGGTGIARGAWMPPPPPPLSEFAQRAATTLVRSPALGIVAVVGLVVLGTIGVVALSEGGNQGPAGQ